MTPSTTSGRSTSTDVDETVGARHALPMPVPIGSAHSAHATAEIAGAYRCAHCEREFVAHAFGESSGESFSPLFLREEGAANAAVANAREHAQADAHENVLIAPCPRCGLRQPRVALRFWGFWGFVTALPVLAIPFIGGFAWLVYGGWQAGLVALFFTSLAAFALRAAHQKWTQGWRVVRFEPAVTSRAQPASAGATRRPR